jgi:CheY-like chemotaxis protein
MEAVGQLTGGIAHDFNNLLTAVIGHLEMAQTRVAADSRTTALLQAALSAAERGASLTQHLLAFARRQLLNPRPVDVSSVIDGLKKLLKQSVGPAIRLVIHAEASLWPARVDPNQLELAILNLALNARDAMEDGGTLRIACENRPAQNGGAPRGVLPGDYVIVSVSDTGKGMDQATMARAFEPFFTTKEVGRGSGLGLSMVQGFAVQSGGSVQIASALGGGTNVELWLPRADAAGSAAPLVADAESEPAPMREARILICDDDADVRGFVGALLRDSGYMVWEANNPVLALQILQSEQPIDLLLTDYAMPELSGETIITRAREFQPAIKVLLMSGHADVLRAGGVSGIPLLAKPFRVAELRKRVVEALRGPSSGARVSGHVAPH